MNIFHRKNQLAGNFFSTTTFYAIPFPDVFLSFLSESGLLLSATLLFDFSFKTIFHKLPFQDLPSLDIP
jgi:hypothetical protein